MPKLSKVFNFVAKYGVALLIAAIPLYPKFPFLTIPGIYVAVRLEDFLLLALSTLFLIEFIPSIKSFFKNHLERSVLLFLVAGLVSLVSGILLTKTVVPNIGLLHWVRRIEYFIPLFIGIYSLKGARKSNLEFYIKILLITVLLVFLYGFGQKHFNFPVIITQNEEYSKGVALRWIAGTPIGSTFAGHYDLSAFLIVVLPVVVSLFFTLKSFISKFTVAMVFFAGLWLLSNSVSRISVVAYLGSAGLALYFLKKYLAIPVVIIISLVYFSFSSSLLTRYSSIVNVVVRKVVKLSQTVNIDVIAADLKAVIPTATVEPTIAPEPVVEDRSTSIRLNVEWPRAIRAFSKNPLLGTGYSSISLATDNDFLRLLGEVGLFGFTAFIIILSWLGITYYHGIKTLNKLDAVSKAFVVGMVASFPGVILDAIFIDVFEASKFAIIFWLFTGFTIAIIRQYQYEQNK